MAKATRKYGLYRRLRTGRKWERIGLEYGLSLASARRVYQSELIANAVGELDAGYEYRLRPLSWRELNPEVKS